MHSTIALFSASRIVSVIECIFSKADTCKVHVVNADDQLALLPYYSSSCMLFSSLVHLCIKMIFQEHIVLH